MNLRQRIQDLVAQHGPAAGFAVQVMAEGFLLSAPEAAELVKQRFAELAVEGQDVPAGIDELSDLGQVRIAEHFIREFLVAGPLFSKLVRLATVPDLARECLDHTLMDEWYPSAETGPEALGLRMARERVRHRDLISRMNQTALANAVLVESRLLETPLLSLFVSEIRDIKGNRMELLQRFRGAVQAVHHGQFRAARNQLKQGALATLKGQSIMVLLAITCIAESLWDEALQLVDRLVSVHNKSHLKELRESIAALANQRRKDQSAPANSRRLPSVGDEVGGWILERRLDSEGYFFLAGKEKQRRYVELIPDDGGNPTGFEERFRKHVRAFAAHSGPPGAPQAVQSGYAEHGKCWYIQFQAPVEGQKPPETLKKRLKQAAAYSPVELVQLFHDLAVHLDAWHGRKVFHQDIQAENILIEPDGSPLLIRARVESSASAHPLGSASDAGPPPEASSSSADPQFGRRDVHALGAALLAALDALPGASELEASLAAALKELRQTISQIINAPAARPPKAKDLSRPLQAFLRPLRLEVPRDHRTIQAALNASRPGCVILVKAGTYQEGLSFKPGVTLKGEDRDRVIVRTSGLSQSSLRIDSCETGLVKNITFEQTGQSDAERRHSVVALNSSSVALENCVIRGGVGHGLWIGSGSSPLVRDCVVEKCMWEGISVQGQQSSPTLQNNILRHNQQRGLCYTQGAGGLAEGNHCHHNQGGGISAFDASTRPALRKNHCESNESHGIYFGKGATGNVERNLCEANSRCGIFFNDVGTQGTLSFNQCVKNTLHGIGFEQGAGGTLEQNDCDGNKDTGIVLRDKGTNPVLIKNRCRENVKHGVYFGRGAGGLAEGNRCDSNQRYGILVYDPGTAPTLRGNFCRKNALHGIGFENGAGGLAEANQCDYNRYGILAFDPGTFVTLRANYCRRNVLQGIGFEEGAGGVAEENHCLKNADTGIVIRDVETAPTLRMNHCLENEKHGMYFSRGAGGVIEENHCCGNKRNGILVYRTGTTPKLVGNFCRNNQLHGIGFEKGAGGLAEGNCCEGNQDTGIVVRDEETAPHLTFNQCCGNAKHGIYFDQGANGIAESNVCENNQDTGIVVRDAQTRVLLRKNHCHGNGKHSIQYDNGATPVEGT